MIGTTIGRYIFTNYIKVCLLVSLIVSVLCVLIDFTQSSAHLSSMANYKNIYAFTISILRLPFLLLQTLPFIILISGLIYFFIQNKYHELVIMRSIGISAWQFVFPVCTGAFIIGIIAIFILNPLSAYSLTQAKNLITNWQDNNSNFENNLRPNPWLIQKTSEGETELHAQSITKNISNKIILTYINNITESKLKNYILTLIKNDKSYVELLNTNFIFIAPNNTTENIPNIKWIYANKAFLLPGYWLIIKPQIYTTTSAELKQSAYLIKTNIQPQFIETYLTDPNTVAFYKLLQKIKIAKNFGYNPYGFKMVLHYLISLPMLLASMALIAATTSLRFSRPGNIKLYAIFGILAGFVLYLTSNITQSFAKVGLLAPFVAAWTPVAAAIFIGLSFLLKQEDG